MLYDKDIREPLFEYLEEKFDKIRILEEKRTGSSRADVVMVTADALYGVEIKSDADTYTRLARQVRDYDLFYDYNYVVVGGTHAGHIAEHVPDYWGIISVEGEASEVDFYVLRSPQKNPKVKWENKIRVLWRPELAHIQELNKMPKYKRESKAFVQKKLLEYLPEETLQRQLCEELFERDYEVIAETIQQFRRQNHLPSRRKKKSRRYR